MCIRDSGSIRPKPASLVRNFTFELIESQIDSLIPQPKVTSKVKTRRKIQNARVIEAMLRNSLAKMAMDRLNGEEERITRCV